RKRVPMTETEVELAAQPLELEHVVERADRVVQLVPSSPSRPFRTAWDRAERPASLDDVLERGKVHLRYRVSLGAARVGDRHRQLARAFVAHSLAAQRDGLHEVPLEWRQFVQHAHYAPSTSAGFSAISFSMAARTSDSRYNVQRLPTRATGLGSFP